MEILTKTNISIIRRAMKKVSVPITPDLHAKDLHELTFEEFKSLFWLDALITTRFNRVRHWEKFLWIIYEEVLIAAVENKLNVPLRVLESVYHHSLSVEHLRYGRFFRDFLKSRNIRVIHGKIVTRGK